MAKKNVKKQAMSLLSLLATIVVVAGGYLLSDTRAVTLLIIPIMSIGLRQVKAHLVRNWLIRY